MNSSAQVCFRNDDTFDLLRDSFTWFGPLPRKGEFVALDDRGYPGAEHVVGRVTDVMYQLRKGRSDADVTIVLKVGHGRD